jgi:serine/threonine-protein kinase HipA
MVDNKTVSILMNGIQVGLLEKTKNAGLIFTYDKNWLGSDDARPISLSLPLTPKPHIGNAVYNFFDNLLPDNPQIRARIQRKFHIRSDHPFDLLASIGKDCIGAIQIAELDASLFTKEIRFETLTPKKIAAILRGYQMNPLGMTDESDDFRISLAGAQEKAAFLFHEKKWCRPHGPTPTTHIFKLPIGIIQHQNLDLRESCENEWICSKIIEAFGLPVAHCEIKIFDGAKVLVVERFDRKLSKDGTWILRLPQEDMCQALGVSSHLKYQSDGGPGIVDIMKLLMDSSANTEDRDRFFYSQVLFYLLAGIDGHAKNFSVFIEANGRYRLTPLYDVISAHPLIKTHQLQAQKIKMAMALEGKNRHYRWNEIQRRHFLETAKAANYSVENAARIMDEALNKVESVVEAVSKKLPKDFPKEISEPIFKGMIKAKKHLSKE